MRHGTRHPHQAAGERAGGESAAAPELAGGRVDARLMASTESRGAEARAKIDLRFGSNAVRLSAGLWAVAGLVCLTFFVLAPGLWEHLEEFHPGADYRIAYDLSNDYWLWARYARWAVARDKALVIGDSVVWGQYVKSDQTLSHCLAEAVGDPQFANLGLDGAHPAALAGLLRYYGGDIANARVVLHCNLLWTASKKHDLRGEKEFRFNHPSLVPQFVPGIPCYTEPYSRRVGIAIERLAPFFGWTNHLRVAYLASSDLPTWTMEHPVADPVAALRPGLPPPDDALRHEPVPWTARGITRQDFAWVDLDTSLQWQCFRDALRTLRTRGNKVFVLVGPFNEHMLNEGSLAAYRARKEAVGAWLRENNVPCLVPDPLPSDLCADASHPLAEGYRLLARRLAGDAAFVRFAAGR
jgi:hypothetical protein